MTREPRVGCPRLYVSEVDGYPIGREGHHRPRFPAPMLSVSVLDSHYGREEVARWLEEDYPRGPRQTKADVRQAMRDRAAGFAAILNAGRPTPATDPDACLWRGSGTLRGGTHSGYVGGCKCPACREGHARYKRELRSLRRLR